MSIKQQAKDTIQIWSIEYTRDTEGAMSPTYSFVSSPQVMWLWQESKVDTTKKQENVGTSAVILTDDKTVFDQLSERMTVVTYAGKKYQVNSLKNTANKDQVFKIMVTESNLNDMNIIGGLSANGKGALSQV